MPGWTFYYLAYDTTGATGSILFENNWLTAESISAGAVFAVKEIAAPPGYTLPANTLTIVDLFSATGTDYVTISNEPKVISVVINGEKIIQGNPPSEDTAHSPLT